jgi:hypothetical protein
MHQLVSVCGPGYKVSLLEKETLIIGFAMLCHDTTTHPFYYNINIIIPGQSFSVSEKEIYKSTSMIDLHMFQGRTTIA